MSKASTLRRGEEVKVGDKTYIINTIKSLFVNKALTVIIDMKEKEDNV